MPTIRLSRRMSNLFVALFFVAILAVGLLTSASYGQPWDEPWEQDILRLNGNQYAATLGLDIRFVLQSDMPAPQTGLIADSIEKDHGESAYYPMLWLLAQEEISAGTRMTLWHAYTWLLFMAGITSLWMICRRLGLSRLLSSLTALCLLLSPRMFAEGHYNNKDIVLLALALFTVWQGLRLMNKPTIVRALLFSLVGATMANTKIIGVFIWGLCALAVLIHLIATKRMTGRTWFVAITALLSFATFYTLLTPAMWADFSGYLNYVLANSTGFSRWDHSVLFRGAIFNLETTVLPRYYLPYMIVTTTPLWILALVALGQVLALGRLFSLRLKAFTDAQGVTLWLITLLWIVPFLFAVIAQPTMYNGWRHFYFLYGPMLVMAGYGLYRLTLGLATLCMQALRRVGSLLLALCMVFTGTQIALSHPNQYTYYNELTLGHKLPGYLELDYWNVSVLQTLRRLLTTLQPGETATITGAEIWSQTGLTSAYALLTPPQQAQLQILPEASMDAAYVLSNQTYATIGYWTPEPAMQVVAQTNSFGCTLSTIYQRELK